MTQQLNQHIISQYKEKLKPLAEKIKQHQLDGQPAPSHVEIAQATKAAFEYYNYLIHVGIPYGQAAKDAASNHGAYGRLANKYFEMQAKAEGIPDHVIPVTLEQLRVMLAFDDSSQRSDPDNIDSKGNIAYKTIANYHYANLGIFKLSKHAWGGTFFEELMGSGSWMDFGGYDTNVDVQQTRFLEALVTNRNIDGISTWDYIGKLKSLGIDNKGDSTTAILYRVVTDIENGSIKKWMDGKAYAADTVNYQRYVSPDFKVAYYIEKNTGKSVYVESTGVKVEGNVILGTRYTKEELSAILNIPKEWLQEKLDGIVMENGINPFRTFIIKPNAGEDSPASAIDTAPAEPAPKSDYIKGIDKVIEDYAQQDTPNPLKTAAVEKMKQFSGALEGVMRQKEVDKVPLTEPYTDGLVKACELYKQIQMSFDCESANCAAARMGLMHTLQTSYSSYMKAIGTGACNNLVQSQDGETVKPLSHHDEV